MHGKMREWALASHQFSLVLHGDHAYEHLVTLSVEAGLQVMDGAGAGGSHEGVGAATEVFLLLQAAVQGLHIPGPGMVEV